MQALFVFIIHLFSVWKNPVSSSPAIPTRMVTTIPTPTPTSTPTPLPTSTPSPHPVKIKPAISTNQLLNEVNNFRAKNNLPQLSSNPLLCSIALERVKALVTRGSLDNHEGYKSYQPALSKQFHQWWETLFLGSPPKSSFDVVFTFWNNSPGHKASLLSTATYGCGAMQSGYAVFELGRK